MAVAYLGHRFWSFSHRDSLPSGRGFALFALINALTLCLGLAMVALVRYPLGQDSPLVLQLTNVTTIAVGTLIRYFAYRQWIFPAHAAPPEEPPRFSPADPPALADRQV
jgi:putative flippase GtrA